MTTKYFDTVTSSVKPDSPQPINGANHIHKSDTPSLILSYDAQVFSNHIGTIPKYCRKELETSNE